MTNSTANEHSLRIADAGAPLTPTPALPPPSLGWIDQLALRYLTVDDQRRLLRNADDMARALAGPHRAEERLQLVARALASARHQVAVLEQMQIEYVALRDARGVTLVDRALGNANRRLCALLAEHRHGCGGERAQVMVAIGSAAHVSVGG